VGRPCAGPQRLAETKQGSGNYTAGLGAPPFSKSPPPSLSDRSETHQELANSPTFQPRYIFKAQQETKAMAEESFDYGRHQTDRADELLDASAGSRRRPSSFRDSVFSPLKAPPGPFQALTLHQGPAGPRLRDDFGLQTLRAGLARPISSAGSSRGQLRELDRCYLAPRTLVHKQPSRLPASKPGLRPSRGKSGKSEGPAKQCSSRVAAPAAGRTLHSRPPLQVPLDLIEGSGMVAAREARKISNLRKVLPRCPACLVL